MTTTNEGPAPATVIDIDGEHLRAAATYFAARREIQPLVDELVSDLADNPLGCRTAGRVRDLDRALSGPRAREGRAARDRLDELLDEPAESAPGRGGEA